MGTKEFIGFASVLASGISVAIAILIVLRFMDFTLPLGLLAIVLGLAALWLQGEGK